MTTSVAKVISPILFVESTQFMRYQPELFSDNLYSTIPLAIKSAKAPQIAVWQLGANNITKEEQKAIL
jgi:hypothetical protein